MFTWLRLFLAELVASIHNAMVSLTEQTLGLLLDLAVAFVQYFIDQMPGLDTIDLESALDVLFNSPHYEFMMYLFPFRQCFAIWLVAMTIAVSIRTLRFVVGWIPTIEG